MRNNTFWGFHLMLDCAACDREKIKDAAHITKFTKQLVKDIDMVAYGEPQIVKFGTGNKAGYTLVQLIETSNICAHFCDDSGDMYLDVFSCKPFKQDIVNKIVYEFFKPERVRTNFIVRDTVLNCSSKFVEQEIAEVGYN